MHSIHGDAFESHISGKKVALILTPIANPLYLRYIAEIISRAIQNPNTNITLINLMNVNFEFTAKKTLPGGSDANGQIEILNRLAETYKESVDSFTVDGNMYINQSKKLTINCKRNISSGRLSFFNNRLMM